MAKTKTVPNASTPSKLPRLPKGTKITKRPLLHPAIAAPRTGSQTQKAIYVSATTPFISTVKRVRKYLSEIDARASGPISLLSGPVRGPGKDRPKQSTQGVVGGGAEERKKEEVVVKGTGKAVDAVLRVALFFQGQEDVLVRLRTGSVGAVDDVAAGTEGGGGEPGGEDAGEVPETRLRRTSMIEVAITLR